MPTLLRPGDRLAGYQIGHHIGTGSSAEVYAARTPAGAPCVIKIMRAPDSGKMRARFAQEGEALARIVHPNVVRVLDAGAEGDLVWLALELVEGETLGQKIRAGVRLPPEGLLDWTQQVCDGLAEAHRQGVLHRDLSPDNIFLMRDGRAKIIDFGMAKLRMWGVVTTRERQIGSGKYLAPEVAADSPPSPGPGLDIYALGHVLYQAITGVHAMGDAPLPMLAVIAWHRSTEPRPLRELAPWVPPGLAALVHDMLAKDPAKRPASAHAVLLRVRQVCADLRAPQLRAVRSVPGLDAAAALAPTIPIAACDVSVPEPRTAPDRAAVLPASWPAPTSGTAPSVAAPIARPPDPTVLVPVLAEPRATDVPVEGAARRSSITPRRVSAAAFVLVGGAAIAAAGWIWVTRAGDPEPGTAGPPAAASPSAPLPAPAPAPVAAPPTASASATPPPKAAPARRQPRTTPRTPARNRLFGTEP
jgi:tRNA A-37 threonylcarbamoyl transferase component Bud32